MNDELASKEERQQPPRFGVRGRILVWLKRIVLFLLALVFLLAVSGFTYQWIQTASESRRFPPQGTMVDVGGHRLHLRMMGKGSPTVLLEAPMGGSSLGWSLVQQEIAKTTRVISYDRAGNGWSEPGSGERTCDRIVSELRLMLSRAGCAGPFVLVGSSFGGVVVRALAFQHPEDVAGMVLVDSAHEDQFERYPQTAASFAKDRRQIGIARVLAHLGVLRMAGLPIGEASMGILPAELLPAARAVGFRASWADAIYGEMQALPRSFVQVRAAKAAAAELPLGDKPVIVLTRGPTLNAPADVLEEYRIWRELQLDLVHSSSQSEQVIAAKSGHFIQADQPQVVVEAVEKVVRRARERSTRR